MFWISFSGTRKEAEECEYSLKIVNAADRTKYVFTGSRQCVGCDVSHKDMQKEMKALFIDKDLLKKAAKGHGENALELRIMITKQQ